MKMTKLFPRPRFGEVQAKTIAHQLLLKGNFIDQTAPGVYTLLPLGFRVLRKINDIVWDLMDEYGVQNLQLPILQPKDLWEQTGRWESYIASKTMFTTTERHADQQMGLAPTAEEVITKLATEAIQSYKDLPVVWHQIGSKFRDEIRPRGGLLRGREFVMSDAYSFDKDEEGMRANFEMFREIYTKIFERLGLPRFISVQADSGAIGGSGSAEFMALSEDGGEDILITCDKCEYGANAEKANGIYPKPTETKRSKSIHIENTPGTKTIEELTKLFPEISPTQMVKTIIFTVDQERGKDKSYEVAVCMRGDLDINEIKLINALGAQSISPSSADVVKKVTGAEVGFAGPIGLKNVKEILFDESVEGMSHFLCGVNQTDKHALDVVPGDDFEKPKKYYNLNLATKGHVCLECDKGTLQESRGIEIGHIFMLQHKYSEPMNATYLGEDNKEHLIWMGTYGLGTTRLVQAIADQSHDDKGLIWPDSVAPFQVSIIPMKYGRDETQTALADDIYKQLTGKGIDVILDDRKDVKSGAKFKDDELMGIPLRIIVGRRAEENIVEFKNRKTDETKELSVEDILKHF